MAGDEKTEDRRRLDYDVELVKGGLRVQVSDGAVVQIQPIVLDVVREPGTNEFGEPVYTITGGLAVRLMKKPGETKHDNPTK